jgi:hypothetical protein
MLALHYFTKPVKVNMVFRTCGTCIVFQSFTRQSKFTYGLVLEEITARDEENNICKQGSRTLPSGVMSSIGPPTTFSGTGVDRMAFLQANITRDNTEFVNGATIGNRCIFQVYMLINYNGKNTCFFPNIIYQYSFLVGAV